ncbi:hypothetical protein HU200_043011 [Digitaria exilis]|uniref:Endonuclease/exonuclease/phosphatase domain-containing protein n=1 Tax=Digitaria exilis TaxID=1010633 RepID=A0A835B538_9POAL|nr:hypothetical protein HU200_043011 [Digitaria exilis]
MASNLRNLSLLSWNVRGLGDKSKCTDVRLSFPSPPPNVLCLQETKLQHVDLYKAASFLPHLLANSYTFQPSVGASGGLLTAWDPTALQLLSTSIRQFTITSTFHTTTSDLQFSVTNCYGPCLHADKMIFLDELVALSSQVAGPSVLLGDFNLVRNPTEKSTRNIDQSELNLFNAAIDTMALQELPLLDRRFTWSNHQEVPILAKLDQFLVSTDWSLLLPNSLVTSASSQASDHCQIILTAKSNIPAPAIFRFDNYCLWVPECVQLIAPYWSSVQSQPGTQRLVRCLKRCRVDLKQWKRHRRSPKDSLHNYHLVIAMLDRLEEYRPLLHAEFTLRTMAKEAAHDLTAQLAAFWRQRGKIKTCTLGDDNTRFFHLSTTVNWRHHQIRALQLEDGTPVYNHDAKAAVLHAFYSDLLGQTPACTPVPGLEHFFSSTRLSPTQAANLIAPFSLPELKDILASLRRDCAPGPDGFTPMLYQANWILVSSDLLDLLNNFHQGTVELHRLNKAYLALLPKKDNALHPKDYRLISLQNCATKLCTKGMTRRL